MATELGAAYVSVLPSMKGVAKAIGAEFDRAFTATDRTVEKAGQRAGVVYSNSFGKGSAKGLNDLAALQRELEAQVKKSSKAVEAARQAEADATRKVALEETKLVELRDTGKAKASQLLAAEDRLIAAQRKLQAAQGDTAAAAKGADQAQARLTAELAKGEDQVEKTGRSFGDLGGKIKASLKGKTSGMFRPVEKEAKSSGDTAGKGFGGTFGAAAKGALGAAAILGGLSAVGGFVGEAIGEAREGQKVAAATEQIVKATGSAANLSAEQIGELATSISNKTGIDDEAIQSGANLLLTFKNVKNEVGEGSAIFDRATTAAADLSAAGFGSIEGSSKTLGKALNDPLKGISALSKSGVTFTDQQKEQIKVLTESGDVLGAQKIILAEVEGQVGGVAAASATAGEKLATTYGNFQEQLGTAFLPILDRLFGFLGEKIIPALSSMVTVLETKAGPAFNSVKAAVAPVVDAFAGFFAQLAGGGNAGAFFTNLKTAALPVAATLRGLATEALPLVMAGLRTIGAFIVGEVVPRFLSIQRTVAKLYATVAPIIAELAAVIVDRFRQNLPVLRGIFENVRSVVLDVMTAIQAVISKVTAAISFIWDRWGGQIKAVVGATFDTVLGILSGAFKVIAGLVKVVTGVLTGDFTKAKEGLRGIFEGLKTIVLSLFGALITGLINAGKSLVSWLGSKFKAGVAAAKEFVLTPFRAARDGLNKLTDGIKSKASAVTTYLATSFKTGAAKAKEYVLTPIRNARDGLKALTDGIASKASAVTTYLRTTFREGAAKAKEYVLTPIRNARDGLKTLTDGIRSKASAVTTYLATSFKTGAAKAKEYVLSPIRNARDGLKALTDGIASKASAVTTYLRTTFRDGAAKAKDYVLAPLRAARDGLKTVTDGIRSKFDSAVEGFRRAFDKLRGAAKDPVRFVVETVLQNGILRAFRDVAGALGLDSLASKMNVSLPRGFARGGILPGSSSWRNGDTHLRPMREGEGVYVSEAMRDPYERARLHAVNAAAMRGQSLDRFRGYAKGGVVAPVAGPRPAWNGGRYRSGGWHGGLDYPVPTGTPVHAFMAGTVAAVKSLAGSYGKHVVLQHAGGLRSIYAHLSSTMVSVGQSVSEGVRIALSGNTGNSTGAHLHFEVDDGRGTTPHGVDPTPYLTGAKTPSGGGLFDLVGLGNKMTDAMKNLRDRVGSSPFGQIVGAIPGRIKDAVLEKVKSVASSVTDAVRGAVGNVAQSARVARWTPTVVDAMRRVGVFPDPLTVASTLRRLNQESGGNERAINNWDINAKNGVPSKGLMQVIGPTFASYRDRSLSSDIYDPLANIVASMRYALARYGSLRAAYDRPGGYAEGTRNARRGLHLVGEEGPELLWFRGGESVLPAGQTAAALQLATDSTRRATTAATAAMRVGQADTYTPPSSAAQLAAASARGGVEFSNCTFGSQPEEVAAVLARAERRAELRFNLQGVA